jgi:hypothetical protein
MLGCHLCPKFFDHLYDTSGEAAGELKRDEPDDLGR